MEACGSDGSFRESDGSFDGSSRMLPFSMGVETSAETSSSLSAEASKDLRSLLGTSMWFQLLAHTSASSHEL